MYDNNTTSSITSRCMVASYRYIYQY